MEYVRPSILHRPAKNGSNCTLESADEQWRKEQELLAARSRRLQDAETRLLNALYPSSEHVRARQAEVLEMQEQHMAAKAEAEKREAQLEAQISQKARSSGGWDQQLQPQASDPVRPWATATLGYATQDEEREARKHFAAQTAADNLALMAERAAQRRQQQQEQQLLERQVVTSESEYWNLGASTRRWIAPEHRHLAPPSPAHPAAASAAAGQAAATSAAPPWATHNPLVPAAAPASSAAAAAAVTAPPWATHTGAAAAPWAAKAGSVSPPWATYTPQPMRSAHGSLGGVDGALQRPGSSAGSMGGSRDAGSMRPHTAGGFEHDALHSQRSKPQVARKYPWEWHEQ